MIPQLATDPYANNTRQTRKHLDQMVDFFTWKLWPHENILDIGDRNPLTDKLEKELGLIITNTSGDIDDNTLDIPDYYKYDHIIYSHIMEHQFNPLYTLLRLKEHMKRECKIYIAVPDRGKLLWDKGHFHEIDRYRMGLLIKRAGLQIIRHKRFKERREWWFYLTGVRPLLRYFFEYDSIYTVILK